MRDRIMQINPECVVNTIEDFVTLENMAEIMSNGYDYVVDAIDSVNVKSAVIAHCRFKPNISRSAIS